MSGHFGKAALDLAASQYCEAWDESTTARISAQGLVDAIAYVSDLEARLEKAEAERDAPTLPESLTPEQLGDACLSYRHDFGLLDSGEQFSLRWQAAEWWRALSRAYNRPTPPQGGEA